MNALQRHHVRVSGTGSQAIVFVHGFGCDQHMWRFVVPAFEAAYRVVLLDLVGAGHSDLTAYDPARYSTLAAHAEDVRAVLQALELHDVVFVGHSVSAMIGVLAAIQEPARFARLVLVTPSPRYLNDGDYTGGFEAADIDELLDVMDSNYLGWAAASAPVIMAHPEQPALAAELANSFCRTDPAIARHFAAVTFRGDERAELPRVRTPALILQSARDLLAPLSVGTYVHEHLAGSELVVLDTTGHCPHLSAPQAIIAAIQAYLPVAEPPFPLMATTDEKSGPNPYLTQQSAENFYEHAPCGYGSCLPDGTLVKVNHTLLHWLGYAREELVGRRRLQQLLTTGGALHFEMHGEPLLLLQGYVRELSYLLRRQDGTPLPVLLDATLVRNADGSPRVMHITLFDITARRQYEQELLRAKNLADLQREQLAQANAALIENNRLLTLSNADLDTFVYTASHDLKTPISNIKGLVRLLASQLPAEVLQQPAVVHLFTLMKASVDRFTETIHQLGDITRLQQAQAPPAEAVDLAALLDAICLDLAPELTDAGAQVTVAVAQCPRIHFAPGHLRSILYNLLSNGIKYAHPGRAPLVQVRCHRSGPLVVLEVQDNGLGLSDAQQAQLFGPFQRLHTHVEGTGIGLYAVKRIVENAGGTIAVQSAPDQGTTFTVALPEVA